MIKLPYQLKTWLFTLCLTAIIYTNTAAQYDCNSPVVISDLPYSANTLTTSTGASYMASSVCGSDYNEQNYIFKYTPDVEQEILIDIIFNQSVEGGIYIFTGCAQPPTNCVTFEENTEQIDLNFSASAGQDYYIFIGSDGTEDFDITITKYEVNGIAINKSEPTQTLDINGSVRIGESNDPPYEGTMKWDGANKEFRSFNGSIWENMKTRNLNELSDAKNLNGSLALGSSTGDGNSNIFIGNSAGGSSSGDHNIYLGNAAGILTSGTRNIFIGNNLGGISNTLFSSNKLIIESNFNGSDSPLIEGDFDTDILEVNGQLDINTDISAAIRINSNSPGFSGLLVNAAGSPYLTLFSSAAGSTFTDIVNYPSYFEINRSGAVYRFTSSGEASKATAGEWLANSDRRLKRDIVSLNQEDMLSKVLQMRGVSYKWDDEITGFKRPEGDHLGFIAQELQEVWPEKVSEDKDGYLQTSYGTYDPVFVEAIKALAKKIEDQEKEIQALKKIVKELTPKNSLESASVN